ncbi:acetate--CoA ligase family protein [Bradyrhizobium sp. USDA 3315]
MTQTLITSAPVVRASISSVFNPASIAVVGASWSDPAGRVIIENFSSIGYRGRVVAVNPRRDESIGYPCYPTLRDLPFVPECVVVCDDRHRVLEIVSEAAEIGSKAAVIFAVGFAEAGSAGQEEQQRLRDVALAAGMAVIGPNSAGLINFVNPCAMYIDVVKRYEPGCVALFAHSGAILNTLLVSKRGVRWNYAVGCGNEAALDSADLLAYFVDDVHTRVICGFMETIREPKRFFQECDRARAAGKPVIVLKAGRTEAARRAATAHSGALSAPDRLYEELFRRHGVLRVDSTEELLETAIALQSRRRPRGGRVAAIAPSGGNNQLTLDETGKYPNLSHPEFAPATKKFLRGLLPDFLATSNPLDFSGTVDLEAAYPRILKAVADDENIDLVVAVARTNHYPILKESGGRRAIEMAAEIAARTDKLVVLLTPTNGEPPPDLVEEALRRDVLLLSGFQQGYRALERLVTWTRPPACPGAPATPELGRFEAQLDQLESKPLAGQPALDALQATGLATVQSLSVDNPQAAVSAAARLGYPVVVKIGDADVFHKTEARGVVLNVADPLAVRAATTRLQAAGTRSVLVQSQVSGGVEMFLGLQTDPSLGSFIVAGLGGIWTEVLNDVAIRPVGLREGDAAAMLAELRSRKLLEGARGAEPLDLAAFATAIEWMDAIGRTVGSRLEAIDVNPLVVLPVGVVAVDALIVPRS